ncbi:hypothetical protein M9H77_35663 [Catharanthus roseus]|uniref:Uncharacterized protein n=1 Tax=Catharanthus roseus TaxID=4058 RepID=A0ACB9ZRJ0_CATRO|nr:hypothetical protein M9H77_35663 [Catharanthus roseus]
MKFLEYCQGLLASNDREHVYGVLHPNMTVFRHTIIYNENTLSISCTCKMFSEVGILCSHSLHVFNFLCVQPIPNKYILKRRTKDIDVCGGSSGVGNIRKDNEGRPSDIKDPVGRCAKRLCNVRKKSIAEIKCNQARGKMKSTLIRASRIKTAIQFSITNEDLGRI